MPVLDFYDKNHCPFQKIIDEKFGGDVHLFLDANRLYFEEYNHRKYSWEDINRAAIVLPELEAEGKQTIKDMLGYLPSESVTLLHEPVLRAIIQQERSGLISFEEYYDLADETIKLIRNDDLGPHSLPQYDRENFDLYHKQWEPYGQKAKERVTVLLGYEPDLEHSVMAENMIRSFFAASDVLQTKGLTEFDYMAVAVIKFREVLMTEGIMAAKASNLWGIELENNFEKYFIEI